MRVVYQVRVDGEPGVPADGIVRRGELEATPETLLPIANAIWRRVWKDLDNANARAIVECWDKHAALPEQQRFAPGSMLLQLAHGYPVGAQPTVWDECEKLLKWGAIAEYGVIGNDKETICSFWPINCGLHFDAPVSGFLETVRVFKAGWLAARSQADSETWAPGEMREIGISLQLASWSDTLAALDRHGKNAQEQAEELQDALEAELDAAPDDEHEDHFRKYLLKGAALLADFEAGSGA